MIEILETVLGAFQRRLYRLEVKKSGSFPETRHTVASARRMAQEA